MRLPWPVLLPFIAILLGACAAARPQWQPALRIDPGPASQEELVRVITGVLTGHADPAPGDVRLANDAFSRNSLLMIERNTIRDPGGRRVQGRELREPEQFQLVLDGRRCALIHLRTGRLYHLSQLRCTAATRQE